MTENIIFFVIVILIVGIGIAHAQAVKSTIGATFSTSDSWVILYDDNINPSSGVQE
jgi:hypothetical protein